MSARRADPFWGERSEGQRPWGCRVGSALARAERSGGAGGAEPQEAVRALARVVINLVKFRLYG